jgi:hypothetical protein
LNLSSSGKIDNSPVTIQEQLKEKQMADRLVELALEALEARKTAIEVEIQKLRSALPRTARRGRTEGGKPGTAKARRRGRSAAARKAQSQKMKEYWARRRAELGAQTAGPRSRKRR